MNTKTCNLEHCKHKLKLTDFKCRCKFIYCTKHRPPEFHSCMFDYKEPELLQDKIDFMKCVNNKVESI